MLVVKLHTMTGPSSLAGERLGIAAKIVQSPVTDFIRYLQGENDIDQLCCVLRVLGTPSESVWPVRNML